MKRRRRQDERRKDEKERRERSIRGKIGGGSFPALGERVVFGSGVGLVGSLGGQSANRKAPGTGRASLMFWGLLGPQWEVVR